MCFKCVGWKHSTVRGFKTFAVFRMQSVFFWEFPHFLKFRHQFHTRAADRIYKRTSFALLRERIHYNRRELNRISGLLLKLHLRLTSCLSSSQWDLIDRLSSNKDTQMGELARKRQLHKFASLHTSQHSGNKTIKRTDINLSSQELDEGSTRYYKKV